jgi:hypothetical protein
MNGTEPEEEEVLVSEEVFWDKLMVFKKYI